MPGWFIVLELAAVNWIGYAGLFLAFGVFVMLFLGPYRQARRYSLNRGYLIAFLFACLANGLQSVANVNNLPGPVLLVAAWPFWPLVERILWVGVALHLIRHYARLAKAVEQMGTDFE